MAGIKGQASPEQVKPVSPELNIQAPEGMRFEAPTDMYVEDNIDYASLADSVMSVDQDSSEVDYAALADSVLGEASQVQSADDFSSETPSFGQQISELPSRFKAGLQVTDKEIKQSLEQSFGAENVRTRNGAIEYRGGDKKWREFDAGLELGDVADLSRMAVEEVPAIAATALAAIPAIGATIASGGTAAPLGAAGVAAARSAGAVAGLGMADFLQSLTGVERDKDRNALFEYGTTAVFAPIAGALADKAATWALKGVSKTKPLLAPKDLFKEEIANVAESVDFLKSKGLLENIPGTDTPVILSQLNPSNELARGITEKASSLPQFAQALELQAQNVDKAVLSFAKGLGNITGEIAGSGQKFKNIVEKSIAEEGKLIGKARELLKEQAGNKELPVPKLRKAVEDYATELGFKIGGDTDLSRLKNYLHDERGFGKQASEVIVNKTNNLLEKITNKEGRMTADEILGSYAELNRVFRDLSARGHDVDPLFKGSIGKLRRFLADEVIDKVNVISGVETKTQYIKSLNEYKTLVDASEEFASLLEKDKVASHSLAKAIFDKGKNGLDSLEASKVLLKNNPELLDDVKGQYLQMVRAKTFNAATGKTDWNRFIKEVDSLGSEMLESAFGKEAKEGIKNFKVLGEALEGGKIKLETPQEKATFVKKLVLAGRSIFVGANAVVDIVNQFDADKALATALSKDGIESFLATVPKEQKSLVRKTLDNVRKTTYAAALATEPAVRQDLRQQRSEQGQ